MGKISTGFLKIDIHGFHPYLDKISDVVDIFYRKNSELPINIFLQNHKLIVVEPTIFVNKVEVDHKSIFVNYNLKTNISSQVRWFQELVNDILECLSFAPESITRIGHAIHYIENEEVEALVRKLFSTKSPISNFNDLTIEMEIDKQHSVRKIIGMPIDVSENKHVLLLNLDYYTTNPIKLAEVDGFLAKSISYFEDKNKIFEGVYE